MGKQLWPDGQDSKHQRRVWMLCSCDRAGDGSWHFATPSCVRKSAQQLAEESAEAASKAEQERLINAEAIRQADEYFAAAAAEEEKQAQELAAAAEQQQ